jgi:hypothetical protein
MPFTRFLIFGPSGDLLPSVNLDTLGEKFPPGACVVCHGGNKYLGKFPEDGSGAADLEAHFFPFDIANFEFSSKAKLRREDQEEAIYNLNQNVLRTDVNAAERELIMGWYKAGHTQDDSFTPEFIIGATSQAFYHTVIARSCRTCHIAQRDELSINDLNFRRLISNAPTLAELVCGQKVHFPTEGAGNLGADLVRAYAMPNSKVTFDLFWRDSAQQEVFNRYLREVLVLLDPKFAQFVCMNPKNR